MDSELTYDNYLACFEIVGGMLNKEKVKFNITEIIIEDEEYPCLACPMFILFYDKSTSFYNLSFSINKYRIKQVAYYTNLLTLFFYDLLDISDDHYLDLKEKTLFFGDTAYEKYEKQMYAKNDMCKCPVCDSVVYNNMMNENGYCKTCEEVNLKQVQWH